MTMVQCEISNEFDDLEYFRCVVLVNRLNPGFLSIEVYVEQSILYQFTFSQHNLHMSVIWSWRTRLDSKFGL